MEGDAHLMEGLENGLSECSLQVRDRTIVLDHSIARYYGVSRRQVCELVRRHHKTWPDDFVFELNDGERALIARRLSPPVYGFSTEGVLMLGFVVSSKRAVQLRAEVLRIAVRQRQFLRLFASLQKRLELAGDLQLVTSMLDGMDDPRF